MEQEMNMDLNINDTLLKEETKYFDFKDPPLDPEKLFKDMSALMVKLKGVGLSANQVGLPWSFFVFGDPNSPDDHIGVFNPKIVDYDTESSYTEEGCLSFPGLWVKVKRPEKIRARFTTWDGTQDTMQFGGYSARVFQHEYDHMYGVTMHQRANRFHLDRAKKNLKLLNRQRKRSKDSSLLKHSASSNLGGTL
jgi:peptide deformylase